MTFPATLTACLLGPYWFQSVSHWKSSWVLITFRGKALGAGELGLKTPSIQWVGLRAWDTELWGFLTYRITQIPHNWWINKLKKLIFTQKQHKETQKSKQEPSLSLHELPPSVNPCYLNSCHRLGLVFWALHDIRSDCNINTIFSHEGIRRWRKSGAKQTKMNSAVCSLFVIFLSKTKRGLDYIFRLKSYGS